MTTDLLCPLIKAPIKAIIDPNIIEVINVPIVIGIKKIPIKVAKMNIGKPQKSSCPDQADPIIPSAAKKPISDPKMQTRFHRGL